MHTMQCRILGGASRCARKKLFKITRLARLLENGEGILMRNFCSHRPAVRITLGQDGGHNPSYNCLLMLDRDSEVHCATAAQVHSICQGRGRTVPIRHEIQALH